MSTNTDNPSNDRNPSTHLSGRMVRTVALLYGTLSYIIFIAVFLYAIGFVSGFVVPKTIDSGPALPMPQAIAINLGLLTAFAVQHSGMARRSFKGVLSKCLSPVVERSTYVLCTNLILIAIFAHWQPISMIVWDVTDPAAKITVHALSAAGWLIVLYSSFLISHFELFGLKQVTQNFLGRTAELARFQASGLYRFVRHPIYVGFIIAFWAAPTMTLGHLLFAAMTTAYIFVGIALEERDLIAMFGAEYRNYKQRVAMLIPKLF